VIDRLRRRAQCAQMRKALLISEAAVFTVPVEKLLAQDSTRQDFSFLSDESAMSGKPLRGRIFPPMKNCLSLCF